jgi:hypothetical protein
MDPMRTLFGLLAACTFIAAPLVPATSAPVQSDAIAALAGHWRCTGDGRVAERSYYIPGYIPGPSGRSTPPEIFGRQDTTERDGSPSASFERIRETSAGVRVDAAEGSGTAPARTSPMHFTGRSFDELAPFELTYTVAGDTMQRTARATEGRSPTRRARANPNRRRPRRARSRTSTREC